MTDLEAMNLANQCAQAMLTRDAASQAMGMHLLAAVTTTPPSASVAASTTLLRPAWVTP